MADFSCDDYDPHHFAVMKAVKAHFRKRGIPEKRHSELWFRWVSQKGYRFPGGVR
jgi:hypothetical protein